METIIFGLIAASDAKPYVAGRERPWRKALIVLDALRQKQPIELGRLPDKIAQIFAPLPRHLIIEPVRQ